MLTRPCFISLPIRGLNKLSRILTECPGAGAAANIRNRNDRTPVEIAEQEGNFELADLFRKTARQQAQVTKAN